MFTPDKKLCGKYYPQKELDPLDSLQPKNIDSTKIICLDDSPRPKAVSDSVDAERSDLYGMVKSSLETIGKIHYSSWEVFS